MRLFLFVDFLNFFISHKTYIMKKKFNVMIQFKNLNQGEPYLLFKSKYDEAYSAGQKVIEAISISTFENKTNEVDSRFVNLKFVSENEFIFFSNYKSPKANSFETHNQVAALIYWSSINVQIRMKAKIRKMSNDYNQRYFENRSKKECASHFI